MSTNQYISEAYRKLQIRGKIKKEQISISTLTDEMIDMFEQNNNILVPKSFREYLEAYSHEIDMLQAPLPMDELCNLNGELMKCIDEADMERISEILYEEDIEVENWWCGIVTVPKDDPLSGLEAYLNGFRSYASCDSNISQEEIQRFLPVADWMNAGALCIDTSKKEEEVDYDDPSTWMLRWFDHEEFDFAKAGYLDEAGHIIGNITLPNFKTFIQLYYYGLFDEFCKE